MHPISGLNEYKKVCVFCGKLQQKELMPFTWNVNSRACAGYPLACIKKPQKLSHLKYVQRITVIKYINSN